MLGDALFDQGAHFAHRLFVLRFEGVELGRAGFAFGEQLFELTHERHHTGNLLGQHRLAAVEQRILRGAAHRGGGQVYAHRAIEHGHDRFVEIAAIGELKEGLIVGIALQGEGAVLAHFHRIHLIRLEIAVVDHGLTGGGFAFHHILLSGSTECQGGEGQGEYHFLHVVTNLEEIWLQKYVFPDEMTSIFISLGVNCKPHCRLVHFACDLSLCAPKSAGACPTMSDRSGETPY